MDTIEKNPLKSFIALNIALFILAPHLLPLMLTFDVVAGIAVVGQITANKLGITDLFKKNQVAQSEVVKQIDSGDVFELEQTQSLQSNIPEMQYHIPETSTFHTASETPSEITGGAQSRPVKHQELSLRLAAVVDAQSAELSENIDSARSGGEHTFRVGYVRARNEGVPRVV